MRTCVFNPPHASLMGGACERMIGVTRRILVGASLPVASYAPHLWHLLLQHSSSAAMNKTAIVDTAGDGHFRLKDYDTRSTADSVLTASLILLKIHCFFSLPCCHLFPLQSSNLFCHATIPTIRTSKRQFSYILVMNTCHHTRCFLQRRNQ